jgi:hypothetical protein
MGETHIFAGAGMADHHVFLKFARANPHKGDPVPVFGVHVGLQLKHKARKVFVGGGDVTGGAGSGAGFEGIFQKRFQKELHTKVSHGATEEHRGHLTGVDRFQIQLEGPSSSIISSSSLNW